MTKKVNTHVCPWWLIWTFDNPLRTSLHKPEQIFDGLVQPGQTVLDIGCGAGHFSLGLACLLGPSGMVIAADLQPAMLAKVRARAERAGLQQYIQLHQCSRESIGLNEEVDIVLAFWMVHEVPDKQLFMKQLYQVLKPGGKLLLVEPKVHVSERAFHGTLKKAEEMGFITIEPRKVYLSRAFLLGKGVG